jgi:hypothetical protein
MLGKTGMAESGLGGPYWFSATQNSVTCRNKIVIVNQVKFDENLYDGCIHIGTATWLSRISATLQSLTSSLETAVTTNGSSLHPISI